MVSNNLFSHITLWEMRNVETSLCWKKIDEACATVDAHWFVKTRQSYSQVNTLPFMGKRTPVRHVSETCLTCLFCLTKGTVPAPFQLVCLKQHINMDYISSVLCCIVL